MRAAFRILDNYKIPTDAAEGAEDDVQSDNVIYSATQITKATDAESLVFYHHAVFDRTVHMVDMKQIEFGSLGNEKIVSEIRGDPQPTLVDVTPTY
ncbi:MAG: hypothetical protein AAF667_02480 [Pseudomonadota bacterium]